MKFLMMIFAVITVSACTQTQTTNEVLDDLIPKNWAFMKSWSSSHWKGQDYQATANPEAGVMRLSNKTSDSMFQDGVQVSPREFIQNLKNADIIRRVYNPAIGFFWEDRVADEVIVELGPNFYTLSYADKNAITSMISRAYQQDVYLLKDWKTQKIVGQITTQGFNLF